MVVSRQSCKSSAPARAVMRTAIGVSSKKRRRRVELAAKKKKRNTMPKSIVPVQLAPIEQRSSWTNARGRSVLATLSMLSLIGAGPLNRSDKMLLPALDFSRPAVIAAEPVRHVAAISPNVGLKESGAWRTDGLVPNFLPGFTAPAIEPLSLATPLPQLIQPISWATSRRDEISVATKVASPDNTAVEPLASLEPIGSVRDWLLRSVPRPTEPTSERPVIP